MPDNVFSDTETPEFKERGEYLKSIITEFKSEGDRAAVILGAAQIDQRLYLILQKVLVPNPSGRDELLEGDSPLGTFSAKINLCYRLGLIDSGFARSLHLIRKIRNSFAHEASSGSLNTGAHRDRVRELVSMFSGNWAYEMFRNAFFKEEVGASSDFRCVLGSLVARLDGLLESSQPLSGKEAWRHIPNPKDSVDTQGNDHPPDLVDLPQSTTTGATTEAPEV